MHAFTTPSTLRGGETTCELPGDASTYWIPTLYVGTEPIIPLAGIVYYIKHTYQRVETLPDGLKMVTGNAEAKKAQSKIVGAWSCGGIGGKLRFSVLPQCRIDQALELRIHFPNCWNGKTLDSPNHKRHMAYSVNGACPQSHPTRAADDRADPRLRLRAEASQARIGQVRAARRLHQRLGRGRPAEARRRPQLRLELSSSSRSAPPEMPSTSTGPTPFA